MFKKILLHTNTSQTLEFLNSPFGIASLKLAFEFTIIQNYSAELEELEPNAGSQLIE